MEMDDLEAMVFDPKPEKISTIFSPSGRLFQVEYAQEAIKVSNITSVGLKGNDCAVVITQRWNPPNVVPETTTQLYTIIDEIGCCMTGRHSDSRCQVLKARVEAARFYDKYDFEISADVLSRRVADLSQVATQHADLRPLACNMLLIAYDSDLGPLLFMSDPCGNSCGYRAVACGAKEDEATAYLLKKYKPDLPEAEVVQMGIRCMRAVFNKHLKATDIDVGLVTKADSNFQIMDDAKKTYFINKIDQDMEVDE